MLRVNTVVSGFTGTPYYSPLLFTGPEAGSSQVLVDAVATFWASLASYIYETASITVRGEVEVVSESTGQVTGYETTTDETLAGLSSANALPPVVQGLIRLQTGAVRNGRRVQGRKFIPALTTAAGVDRPTSTFRASMSDATQALMAAVGPDYQLVVFSKQGLEAHPVLAVGTWDKFAVLTSRRD